MKLAIIGLGIGAALVAAAPAQALTFVGTYTASAGTPGVAHVTFNTANTINVQGGYDILAVSGDVDGDVITGLVANPDQPHTSISPDGLFFYDNDFYPGPPVFSSPGVLFNGASGLEYNLFADNATQYELYTFVGGNYVSSIGTFEVAAVPEAATWALMLVGFGAMGAAMRRRTTAVSFS